MTTDTANIAANLACLRAVLEDAARMTPEHATVCAVAMRALDDKAYPQPVADALTAVPIKFKTYYVGLVAEVLAGRDRMADLRHRLSRYGVLAQARSANPAPRDRAARLIRDYAAKQIAENYGKDEAPPAILVAIGEALNADEACHLGRALLARHDAVADRDYRLGGTLCALVLTAIADALNRLTPTTGVS